MPLPYPQTRRDDVVDVFHGEKVADPYRWLEDTSSPETADWVKLQNALTESVLSTVETRGEIRQRLTQVWNYPRIGVRTSVVAAGSSCATAVSRHRPCSTSCPRRRTKDACCSIPTSCPTTAPSP